MDCPSRWSEEEAPCCIWLRNVGVFRNQRGSAALTLSRSFSPRNIEHVVIPSTPPFHLRLRPLPLSLSPHSTSSKRHAHRAHIAYRYIRSLLNARARSEWSTISHSLSPPLLLIDAPSSRRRSVDMDGRGRCELSPLCFECHSVTKQAAVRLTAVCGL